MPATVPTCSVGELTLLFTGDEDSRGAPDPMLVAAICEQVCPDSPRDLYFAMFRLPVGAPKHAFDDWYERMSEAELDALEAGLNYWRTQERLAGRIV